MRAVASSAFRFSWNSRRLALSLRSMAAARASMGRKMAGAGSWVASRLKRPIASSSRISATVPRMVMSSSGSPESGASREARPGLPRRMTSESPSERSRVRASSRLMAQMRFPSVGGLVFPGANVQKAGVTPKRLTCPVERPDGVSTWLRSWRTGAVPGRSLARSARKKFSPPARTRVVRPVRCSAIWRRVDFTESPAKRAPNKTIAPRADPSRTPR